MKNFMIFNVGTGRGTTVLGLIKIFEDTNNIKLNIKLEIEEQVI